MSQVAACTVRVAEQLVEPHIGDMPPAAGVEDGAQAPSDTIQHPTEGPRFAVNSHASVYIKELCIEKFRQNEK